MSEAKFLTPEERSRSDIVAASQWARCETGEQCGLGCRFLKIGKAILYPANELDAWDEKQSSYVPSFKARHRAAG